MNLPKSSQRGAIHIIFILMVLLVIAGIGFIAWKVVGSNKSQQPSSAKQVEVDDGSGLDAKTIKITVKEEGKLILPNGYADPTVVATKEGYRMYVNRQSGGPSGLATFISKDAVTWTKERDMVIPGVSTSRAVPMNDGVRIYYPGPQPIKPSDAQADMFSSFTTDGLTFTKDPGVRLAPRSSASYVEGPTVFQLPNKSWRMYFNENTVAAGMQRDGDIWGASSKDGLTWTRDDQMTIQSDEVEASALGNKSPWKQVLHPFVLANPKGGYIMLYNSHSEIFAATSTDGTNWTKIGQVGIHGADIDGFFQKDGTIRVFYGDFNPQSGGLVYGGVLKVD